MSRTINTFLLILLTMTLTASVYAGDNSSPSSELSPYLQMIVDELGALEDKATSLAAEIPDDKYSWRPGEGVRSVSEVFVHIGGANHFILSFLGKDMPAGFSRDAEKTMTGKEDIAKFLKASFASAKEFVTGIDESGLDEIVELPFAKMSKRKVLFLMANHGHEHLGQAIAYARTNGVTPPWNKRKNNNY